MSGVQERNRLTCVLNLYHEQHGEQPTGMRLTFSESLSVNAERYQRRMRVTEQAIPLDLGWFKPDEVGLILVENLEGLHLQVHPSDEERADLELRVLEVGEPDCSCWFIPPRRFLLGYSSDPGSITVRSQHGTIKMGITIYPR